MAPDPINEMGEDLLEAFKALVRSTRPKAKPSLSSKFVKKMEEIPSLELSPEEPCDLALLLAENVLIGDRKSTRLNSSHRLLSRMPSSA